MMNSITTTIEFSCPCCGEKIIIRKNASGEITAVPFSYIEQNIASIGEYDFGEKGGEKY